LILANLEQGAEKLASNASQSTGLRRQRETPTRQWW